MRFVKGLANSTFTYVPNMIHICPNNIYTVMEREREREREFTSTIAMCGGS